MRYIGFIRRKLVTFFFIMLMTALFPSLSFADPLKNIIFINSQETEPYVSVKKGFINKLAELGYIEGKNIHITDFSASNTADKVIHVQNMILPSTKNIIVANGTAAAIGSKKLTVDKSLNYFLFASVTDPVGMGLIKDFNVSPSDNFTGVSFPVPVVERLRFIKKIMPQVKSIGLVYAEMPQSLSYKTWLETALALPEFKGLEIKYRSVPFVQSEKGYVRMITLAQEEIKSLDKDVDIFMSPNDQMGIQADFDKMVFEHGTKPLVGLTRTGVMQAGGAALSIYASLEPMGAQVAVMAKKMLDGELIKDIPAEQPLTYGMAFNLESSKKYGLNIPDNLIKEAAGNIYPK